MMQLAFGTVRGCIYLHEQSHEGMQACRSGDFQEGLQDEDHGVVQ